MFPRIFLNNVKKVFVSVNVTFAIKIYFVVFSFTIIILIKINF